MSVKMDNENDVINKNTFCVQEAVQFLLSDHNNDYVRNEGSALSIRLDDDHQAIYDF